MAERLVLAELVIDENGVVSGLAAINSGLKGTETQSERTGKKVSGLSGFINHLEKDMFSMRRIANAVLAGFTVAGAIQGLKSLITATLEQDAAFVGLKGVSHSLFETFTKSSGNLLGVHALLEKVTLAVAFLQAAIEKFNTVEDSKITKVIETLFKFSAAGIAIQAIGTMGDAIGLLGEKWKFLGDMIKRAKEISAEGGAVKAVKVPEGEGLGPKGIKGEESNPFIARRLPNEEANRVEVLPQPKVLGDFRVAVESVLDTLGNLHAKLTGVQFAAQATSEAFQQAGSAIGAALSGEAVSGAQVLKSILSSIAKQAAVEGLFELAKGFASLFIPGGQAAAAGHFKSSALFFATAALAGGGARAIGGGASTGGGGGVGAPTGTRGFGQEIGPQQRPAAQNLTVIVQGNVVGNESFVRQLVVDVQRQLLAGTGGGSL